MESKDAVSGLSVLAHPGRLEIFCLLVRSGKDGLPAGEIGRSVGSHASTLSTNLNILSQAGLVLSRRAGRSIIYTVAFEQMSNLVDFLIEDCCGGANDICLPLVKIAERSSCCAPSLVRIQRATRVTALELNE